VLLLREDLRKSCSGREMVYLSPSAPRDNLVRGAPCARRARSRCARRCRPRGPKAERRCSPSRGRTPDPGEVIRRVLRVARLGHLCDAILAQLLRRVEDREAVLVVLAVRDHRVLDRRVALAGRADQRDLRDVVEELRPVRRPGPSSLPTYSAGFGAAGRRRGGGRSGSRSRLARLGSLLRLRFFFSASLAACSAVTTWGRRCRRMPCFRRC